MIPKVIHYCWFGRNPLPKDAIKCIKSWKKFCPDYEIKQWNESNFDFSDCSYAMEAYKEKKWAFVSDYARFKILYENGGVYFDTDVELVNSIEDIVSKGPFMGCEKDCICDISVAPGLGLGVNPGHELYREFLDFYKTLHFKKLENGKYKTVVEYTTEILQKHGLKIINDIQFVRGVYVYPKEYFQPMNLETGRITLSQNTVSVHHYSGSWLDKKGKRRGSIYKTIKKVFGERVADYIRVLFSKKML